ncbi:nucleolar protein,Nop52-domain-containing protein [Lasiosphaeria ovina]|uniref:Nucleolar protein,Nop52-domain-containing protein n=1 Tax=Lasiosphaeria ovina TaxID=92902 RepID=A0AAE0JSS1_9PEZI|nr:nucleolar protein,Nop52-domain-containing protein [Lasiosphaeria ovina]
MASQERSMSFIKNLASSDRKIRTSALASLHNFLSARQVASTLGPLDVLKLWKGLFFALWMCDRAIPQQNLCNELADLIHILPRDATVPWLRGFWATMSREWTSIDVLRMEKFLLLVRRVVGAGFQWMKAEPRSNKDGGIVWSTDRVDNILGLLGEWPFVLDEDARPSREQDPLVPQKVPVGLKLHVLDIWVDEAEKAGLLDGSDQKASEILQRISNQVDILEQGTTSPAVRIRSKESLADGRLPGNKRGATSGAVVDEEIDTIDVGDGGSWDGFED